ncbi:MAG: RNA-binding protein [Pseudomonadota bacterium]|jgi:RNA recognition motif-containing protein
MEAKLYVGNLAYGTTEDDLRTLFSQAGPVTSVALIKDRETGRSKGFAFVEMENQADAQKAVDMLNGTQFQERAIKVNTARAREERGTGAPDGRRGGYHRSGGRGNRS